MDSFDQYSFLPFCHNLYAHLKSSYSHDNLFVSPLSIYSGLALVLAGSDGRTHQEIFDTLVIRRNYFHDFDHAMTKIGEELRKIPEGDKDATLVLANGLFVDSTFRVEEYFNNSVRKHFGAEADLVSFSTNAEHARHQVNDWVARNTYDKIKDLMPPGSIDNQTKLVLANAIYFKGSWEKPFHRDCTMEMPFHTLQGGEISVQMMKDNGVYRVADFPDLHLVAVKIPFKYHEMLLVVPHDKNGLPSVLEKIADPKHYTPFLKLFDKSLYNEDRIELFLPRFKLGDAESIDLKKPISNMGAPSLFDEHHCDLKRMSREKHLCVTAMLHKAMIEVNEEGAEAAAATGMAIAPMSIVPSIKADHPFAFFIVTETGVPAFMGHVIHPNE